jgi:3-oxoacyl-[acyl-carrier-protein] synthase-3
MTTTEEAPIRLASGGAGLSATRILGVGAAQPERTITAAELGAPFGRTAEGIGARTGIHAVRRVAATAEIAQLAAQAAAMALGRAALEADGVDLVLTASCSLDPRVTARIVARVAPRAGWMARSTRHAAASASR